MRHTRSHTKNRRSHHALAKGAVVTDKESGNLRLPHRLDEATGMYRGKLIVPAKAKKVSKTDIKKEGEKEEKALGTHEPAHKEGDEKKPAGILGKVAKGRANSRSGTGS